MLERLDAVPWHDLRHAYGAASDVPALIRALLDHDKTVRDEAWNQLLGNIWHQGTLYQATSHAVPFFIELASERHVPEREAVLGYLVTLMESACLHESGINDEIASRHPSIGELVKHEKTWARETKQAIQAGHAVYADALGAGEAKVRVAGSHLLSLLPQRAVQSGRVLQAHLEGDRETDDVAKFFCLFALGNLGEHWRPAIRVLERCFARETPEIVRVGAAIGVARCLREKTPSNVRDYLLRKAIDEGLEAKVLDSVTWDPGNNPLVEWCRDALEASRVIDAATATRIRSINTGITLTHNLLTVVRLCSDLFERQWEPSSRLTNEQRAVLESVALSPDLWLEYKDDDNVQMIFRIYGLPQTRGDLVNFLLK